MFLCSWFPENPEEMPSCFLGFFLKCQVLEEARNFLLHIFLGWGVLTACLSPSKESKSLNPFFMLPEEGRTLLLLFGVPRRVIKCDQQGKLRDLFSS